MRIDHADEGLQIERRPGQEERQHHTDRNADIGHIEDGEVDEGGGDKISHEAKDKAIDRVADGTARDHRHTNDLQTSELRRTNQVHRDGNDDDKCQHGKRYTMALAHAKGSSDIADKQKVNHTGDNGHVQSIAHGTNRKLGQLVNKQHGKRHPTIGNNVLISCGAKVLGPFKVGDGARIAANAVVLREVPPGATVVGVPGRIVRLCGDKLDHIHTPDPVMLEIEELKRRMALLEQQINDVQKEN